MNKIFYIILFTVFFQSSLFAKLELEEKNFINKLAESNSLSKERVILKKEQLSKIQVPMGNKYKKRIFSYWRADNKTIWILNSIGKVYTFL